MRKITILFPIYNEEKNIPIVYQSVLNLWQKEFEQKYELEIVFVNDGSKDVSWEVIKDLAAFDKRVSGVNFSRNFGHQSAIEAGLNIAKGDAVVMLDSDGQHPVSFISNLIAEWEKGAQIVNTVRKDTENASFLKKKTSDLFYFLLNHISDVQIIPGSADFRLIDRKVVNILKKFPEQAKFYRGLISWVGYRSVFLEYKADKRLHGKSSYTLKRMYKFATDGLTGFSSFPLKVSKYIGIAIFVLGLLGLFGMALLTALGLAGFPIWVYLIMLIFLLNGAQFIVLWFIGNYIGRIYNQQRNRPTYLINEEV